MSSWEDAMTTCLASGGRPLTSKETLERKRAKKINFTFWTAEYFSVSKTTNDISKYLPGNSMCGYASLYVPKLFGNQTTSYRVTAINYGDCAEQKGYICRGKFPDVYLNKTTWLDASKSCEAKTSKLLANIQLNSWIKNDIPTAPRSVELDVWIGLLGIPSTHTVLSEVNAGNVVKYGTLGNDDEFRIIKANQSYELGAMCGFESAKSVNDTNLVTCLSGSESAVSSVVTGLSWLIFSLTVSCTILFVCMCGGVVIYVFHKRKPRRSRYLVTTATSNSEAHQNCSTSVKPNSTEDFEYGNDYYQTNRPPCFETESAINPVCVSGSSSVADDDYTLLQIGDSTIADTLYGTNDSGQKTLDIKLMVSISAKD